MLMSLFVPTVMTAVLALLIVLAIKVKLAPALPTAVVALMVLALAKLPISLRNAPKMGAFF